MPDDLLAYMDEESNQQQREKREFVASDHRVCAQEQSLSEECELVDSDEIRAE